jgi:hypothetical protein
MDIGFVGALLRFRWLSLYDKKGHTILCVIICNNLDANKIVHILSYDFHVFETRVEHDQRNIVCLALYRAVK